MSGCRVIRDPVSLVCGSRWVLLIVVFGSSTGVGVCVVNLKRGTLLFLCVCVGERGASEILFCKKWIS